MDDRLSKEEVMHVANLARIKVTEEEIEKYQIDLKTLLNEVEKINEVVGYDEEILIANWHGNTRLREDEPGTMLDPKEVLKNAPKTLLNKIVPPTKKLENLTGRSKNIGAALFWVNLASLAGFMGWALPLTLNKMIKKRENLKCLTHFVETICNKSQKQNYFQLLLQLSFLLSQLK